MVGCELFPLKDKRDFYPSHIFYKANCSNPPKQHSLENREWKGLIEMVSFISRTPNWLEVSILVLSYANEIDFS